MKTKSYKTRLIIARWIGTINTQLPHISSNPRVRAQQHKPTQFWTAESRKKARDEFYVPPGIEFHVIAPEICDRDLLRKSERHRVQRTGGIMSPCPKCGKNCYMRITGWTSARPSCQKILNGKLTQSVMIGAVYQCYNTIDGCCRRVKKGKGASNETKEVTPSFTSCDSKIWSQFPDSVKRRCTAFPM